MKNFQCCLIVTILAIQISCSSGFDSFQELDIALQAEVNMHTVIYLIKF